MWRHPISTLNVKAVPIKYYAVAIVFMLFDLETVSVRMGAGGRRYRLHAVHVLLFLFLLVLILLYVYRHACSKR